MASPMSVDTSYVSADGRAVSLLPPLMTALDTYTTHTDPATATDSPRTSKMKSNKSIKSPTNKTKKNAKGLDSLSLPKSLKSPQHSKEQAGGSLLQSPRTPHKSPLVLDEDDKDNFSLMELQSPSFPSPPPGSFVKSVSFASSSVQRVGRTYRQSDPNAPVSAPRSAEKAPEVSFHKAIHSIAAIKLHTLAMRRKAKLTKRAQLLREVRALQLTNRDDFRPLVSTQIVERMAAWQLRYFVEYIRYKVTKRDLGQTEQTLGGKIRYIEELEDIIRETKREVGEMRSKQGELERDLQEAKGERDRLGVFGEKMERELREVQRRAVEQRETIERQRESLAGLERELQESGERGRLREKELEITRLTCQELVRSNGERDEKLRGMREEVEESRRRDRERERKEEVTRREAEEREQRQREREEELLRSVGEWERRVEEQRGEIERREREYREREEEHRMERERRERAEEEGREEKRRGEIGAEERRALSQLVEELAIKSSSLSVRLEESDRESTERGEKIKQITNLLEKEREESRSKIEGLERDLRESRTEGVKVLLEREGASMWGQEMAQRYMEREEEYRLLERDHLQLKEIYLLLHKRGQAPLSPGGKGGAAGGAGGQMSKSLESSLASMLQEAEEKGRRDGGVGEKLLRLVERLEKRLEEGLSPHLSPEKEEKRLLSPPTPILSSPPPAVSPKGGKKSKKEKKEREASPAPLPSLPSAAPVDQERAEEREMLLASSQQLSSLLLSLSDQFSYLVQEEESEEREASLLQEDLLQLTTIVQDYIEQFFNAYGREPLESEMDPAALSYLEELDRLTLQLEEREKRRGEREREREELREGMRGVYEEREELERRLEREFGEKRGEEGGELRRVLGEIEGVLPLVEGREPQGERSEEKEREEKEEEVLPLSPLPELSLDVSPLPEALLSPSPLPASPLSSKQGKRAAPSPKKGTKKKGSKGVEKGAAEAKGAERGGEKVGSRKGSRGMERQGSIGGESVDSKGAKKKKGGKKKGASFSGREEPHSYLPSSRAVSAPSQVEEGVEGREEEEGLRALVSLFHPSSLSPEAMEQEEKGRVELREREKGEEGQGGREKEGGEVSAPLPLFEGVEEVEGEGESSPLSLPKEESESVRKREEVEEIAVEKEEQEERGEGVVEGESGAPLPSPHLHTVEGEKESELVAIGEKTEVSPPLSGAVSPTPLSSERTRSPPRGSRGRGGREGGLNGVVDMNSFFKTPSRGVSRGGSRGGSQGNGEGGSAGGGEVFDFSSLTLGESFFGGGMGGIAVEGAVEEEEIEGGRVAEGGGKEVERGEASLSSAPAPSSPAEEYAQLKKELKRWKAQFTKEKGRGPSKEDFEGLDVEIKKKVARRNQLKKMLGVKEKDE